MRFLDCGTITSTSVLKAYPLGDGAPQAIGARSITLATSAVDASGGLDAYRNHRVLIVDGQGIGQSRMILGSSTAYVCPVATWDFPYPNTASTYVVGIPVDGHDAVATKVEYVGTSMTGTWRLQTHLHIAPAPLTSRVDRPRVLLSDSFQHVQTLSSSGLSSSAGLHGATQIIDFLGPETCLAKLFVEIAPTANVELFAAPINTRGRMGQ